MAIVIPRLRRGSLHEDKKTILSLAAARNISHIWLVEQKENVSIWVSMNCQSEIDRMESDLKLRIVKCLHTLVWMIFAGSILAIPLFTYDRRLSVSWVLIGLVLVEVIVLAANRMRCPLTDVAGRYTKDRRDNFDIYLPLWLARYNKQIFGGLYILGFAYTLLIWVRGMITP
jgi:hypothetical protein